MLSLATCLALHSTELVFEALLVSIPPGLLSCVILFLNNIRDSEPDSAAGLVTLVSSYLPSSYIAESLVKKISLPMHTQEVTCHPHGVILK